MPAVEHLALGTPDALREICTGAIAPVAIVTTGPLEAPHGTTVSAFGPVSLDPPLVQVVLHQRSRQLERIVERRTFGLNVLAEDQPPLLYRFARPRDGGLDGIEWFACCGLPRIAGCRGWIAAGLQQIVAAGDHAIVIAAALQAEPSGCSPLLWRSAFAPSKSTLGKEKPCPS